jgi:peptidoglycan hydrolase-like protein with peptidoglycan-binding domain
VCHRFWMDVTLPQVKKGAKGLQISMLQNLLNLKLESETDLSTDGIFGPKTEAAVRAWQAARGLDADGIVGPKSWKSLLEFEGEGETIVRNL